MEALDKLCHDHNNLPSGEGRHEPYLARHHYARCAMFNDLETSLISWLSLVSIKITPAHGVRIRPDGSEVDSRVIVSTIMGYISGNYYPVRLHAMLMELVLFVLSKNPGPEGRDGPEGSHVYSSIQSSKPYPLTFFIDTRPAPLGSYWESETKWQKESGLTMANRDNFHVAGFEVHMVRCGCWHAYDKVLPNKGVNGETLVSSVMRCEPMFVYTRRMCYWCRCKFLANHKRRKIPPDFSRNMSVLQMRTQVSRLNGASWQCS